MSNESEGLPLTAARKRGDCRQSCVLYVNIPFTTMRGDYVRQYLLSNVNPSEKERYLSALKAEIAGFEPDDNPLASALVFGEGALSTLEPAQLRHLIWSLQKSFDMTTLDYVGATFDPGLVSIAHLQELRARGGRVCLSVRFFSADEHESALLGRPNAVIEMGKTDIVLRYQPIESLDMQIAIGIKGQTERTLATTLAAAQGERAHHYTLLRLLPQSPLSAPREQADELFNYACEWLAKQGFERYAPESFAKPGHRRPDVAALRSTNPLYAFGPAVMSHADGLLWANIAHWDDYLAAKGDPAIITASVQCLEDEAGAALKQIEGLLGDTCR
jgi:coproporphyrinogen III oxidase-like Fe-S oxidoreductase